jgi:Xaa-Pro aminopeptidase
MDAILLAGDSRVNPNLYYKTHFVAEGLIYLESDSHDMLIVSEMERGRAGREATVSTVRTYDDYGYRQVARELNDRHRAWATMVSRAVNDMGADRVIVGPEFSALQADSLRNEGVDVHIDPELLVVTREAKTAEELGFIEAAQRANEKAAARAVEILQQSEPFNGVLQFNGIPLTSERLRGEIELVLVKEGMNPGDPIVAGGPGASEPHWLGYGPLKAGEAIVMDIFPRTRTRYWADMTRTVVRGKPSETLRAMYDAVLHAQEAAFGEIRAGANARDAHDAAANAMREAGFDGETGPRYIHGTGHGVGLAIHEAPRLGEQNVKLRTGEVITVEPGLYDPEIGGVRLEDMVLVTEDGYRNLTNFPKQFEI